MSDLRLPVPNHAGWPYAPLGRVSELIARGTAPSYVEASEVLAIGQRCVAASGFDPGHARPHRARAPGGVLAPRRGDVLVNSTGTGTIGRSCVFTATGRFIVDSHVTVVRPRPGVADGRWVEALIRSHWGQRFLESQCYSGSTNQVELSGGRLAKALVPLPPVEEQRRAADVLDAAGEGVRSTERLVATLEQARQALLHDLLAPGLREHGERESRTGRRRAPWEFRELADVLDCNFPGAWGAAPQPAGNVSVLRSTNLDDNGGVEVRTGASRRFSRQEVTDKRLVDGDILLEASGGGPGRPVGRVALFRGPGDGVFAASNFLRTLRPGPSVDGRFLARYLQWVYRQPIIWRFQQQTTGIINLKHREYVRQPVPVPPAAEQERIVEVLGGADDAIWSAQRRLAKLRLVGRGLMDDLLTGRVRSPAGR